jgi:tetratricopeptide (TPR) repeat protein
MTTPYGSYLAGHFAGADGDVDAAAHYYNETLKADSSDDLLQSAFLYSAMAGDLSRASELAKQIIATDPGNRMARLVLAVEAIGKKDYAGTSDQLAQSASGPFTVLTSGMLNAWAHEGAGNTDAALQSLDGLSGQQGVEGIVAFHRALILDHAGRNRDADAAYRNALMIQGGNARVVEAYGRFLERQGRTADAKTFYQQQQAQNPQTAVAAALRRLSQSSSKPEALVSTPADGVAEVLFGFAASLSDPRNSDSSALYLRLSLVLRPNFDLAKILLADRYESADKFDTANDIYRTVPASSPYHATVQIQAAVNESQMGHSDQSIATLRQLTTEQPDNLDAWITLGDLLRTTHKNQEAVDAYNKAVALLPAPDAGHWSLFFTRGVAESETGDWAGAERDFNEALKLNPDQPDVLNFLGYSWVTQNRKLDEALQMLERAYTLRASDGYIADSVGWAYYKLGRYKDAAEMLEKAVSLAGGAADINDHLGDAYWRVGRKLEARFQWNHALAVDPNYTEKSAVERKLQYGLDAPVAGGS